MDATCLLPPPPRRSTSGPAGGAVAAAALEAGQGWQSAVLGPSLQCFEAASLGMPLEVSVWGGLWGAEAVGTGGRGWRLRGRLPKKN